MDTRPPLKPADIPKKSPASPSKGTNNSLRVVPRTEEEAMQGTRLDGPTAPGRYLFLVKDSKEK